GYCPLKALKLVMVQRFFSFKRRHKGFRHRETPILKSPIALQQQRCILGDVGADFQPRSDRGWKATSTF
ncbi:MAG: hypothetical protein PVG08_08480, partial [Desulfobacterales bacterium]